MLQYVSHFPIFSNLTLQLQMIAIFLPKLVVDKWLFQTLAMRCMISKQDTYRSSWSDSEKNKGRFCNLDTTQTPPVYFIEVFHPKFQKYDYKNAPRSPFYKNIGNNFSNFILCLQTYIKNASRNIPYTSCSSNEDVNQSVEKKITKFP